MRFDSRILEALKAFLMRYRSAKWTDVVPEANIVRVDVLAYTADRTDPSSSVYLLIDRIVGDTAYAIVLDETRREVLVSRQHLECYPTLVGGDNHLYFVNK